MFLHKDVDKIASNIKNLTKTKKCEHFVISIVAYAEAGWHALVSGSCENSYWMQWGIACATIGLAVATWVLLKKIGKCDEQKNAIT